MRKRRFNVTYQGVFVQRDGHQAEILQIVHGMAVGYANVDTVDPRLGLWRCSDGAANDRGQWSVEDSSAIVGVAQSPQRYPYTHPDAELSVEESVGILLDRHGGGPSEPNYDPDALEAVRALESHCTSRSAAISGLANGINSVLDMLDAKEDIEGVGPRLRSLVSEFLPGDSQDSNSDHEESVNG